MLNVRFDQRRYSRDRTRRSLPLGRQCINPYRHPCSGQKCRAARSSPPRGSARRSSRGTRPAASGRTLRRPRSPCLPAGLRRVNFFAAMLKHAGTAEAEAFRCPQRVAPACCSAHAGKTRMPKWRAAAGRLATASTWLMSCSDMRSERLAGGSCTRGRELKSKIKIYVKKGSECPTFPG